MNVLDELTARGLVHDVTNREGLARLLASEPVAFYCGFDPTGASLHAGSLVPLSVMARLARCGHKTIAVVGGATGMIGDPSGKTEERKLLDADALARNLESIRAQITRFVSADALVLNNADWTQMRYLDFLRDVGKHITVNYMLAKESVRARLQDREHGISYTEFSYMLLQAHDFVHLARAHRCRLQVGGSDQWGNITCGIELARKMGVDFELFGLVSPLLKTASGQKLGKTEKGTSLWLDPKLTSPYRFYQYWVNVEDADVGPFLRMFTFLSLEEIDALVAEHEKDKGRRVAQRRLAAEVTTWVHGAEATRRVERASGVLFGGTLESLSDADLEPLLDDVPVTRLQRSELEAGVPLVDLFVRVKLADSKGAARRLVQQGGAYLNNVRVTDAAKQVGRQDLATESLLLLRAGKRDYHLVKVE